MIMNKLFQISLLLFFLLALSNLLGAQGTSDDSADSLQRVVMKDSLHLADKVITEIFAIRENYVLQSTKVSKDALLDEPKRTGVMQTLITQTNDGIKNLMGESAYSHYIEMIKRKTIRIPAAGKTQPLASH
jgi:vacuolar-type H+-ATPase catalytic subunit A/Vma1